MKYILALDHGTSGLKPAIYSTEGKLIDHDAEKTPIILLPGGGAEQDANGWWQAFLIATKRLLARKAVPLEDIVAVCVSSQWSCTVPVDNAGKPLMNAISWMDTRGAPIVRKLVRGLINVSGYAITKILRWVKQTGGGPTLAGKDPISHILWLKRDRPEIYQNAYKFLEAKDFMNLCLTGKFAATFDSIQLHWITDCQDLKNVHYIPAIIRMFKLDIVKFPDLIRSTDVLGTLKPEVADELGLSHDVKVFGGSGDLHMAAIGSGAVRDFEGHIYVGTSAFLICHTPFKKTDIFHNIASIPSANPERYFMATEQETAGGALTFIRDLIGQMTSALTGAAFGEKKVIELEYKDLDDIATKSPPGSHGVIFTPWLYGERTPVEDNTVRSIFYNVSLGSRLEDLVRAVFEGVALNARWVLFYAEKFIGNRRLDPLNIIGGGAVSDIWCQIYADVLNRTIWRVKNPLYANALGAAFVASVGLGCMKFDDISNIVEMDRSFTPNEANRGVYDKVFKVFVEIYKKNAPIFRRLNS